MTRLKRTLLSLLVFTTLLALPCYGQLRDPLTDKESDDLREVAQEPLKRLKLLIKYASQRLDTVERLQNEPKIEDRGSRMHDALEDFSQIVDELDDNIEDYSKKQSDLRKPLAEVVSAETSFQSRLDTIKKTAEDATHADFYKLYSYALQDATESVSLSLEDARKTLEEQNELLSKKK